MNDKYPDSKVHGANMEPIWGRQDPGGPHVGPMNLVIWVHIRVHIFILLCFYHANCPVSFVDDLHMYQNDGNMFMEFYISMYCNSKSNDIT